MSHFDGNNFFEAVNEWEIRELTTQTGEKFIGVYIRSGKNEHRFALGGPDPQGWLEALMAATNAKITKETIERYH